MSLGYVKFEMYVRHKVNTPQHTVLELRAVGHAGEVVSVT